MFWIADLKDGQRAVQLLPHHLLAEVLPECLGIAILSFLKGGIILISSVGGWSKLNMCAAIIFLAENWFLVWFLVPLNG